MPFFLSHGFQECNIACCVPRPKVYEAMQGGKRKTGVQRTTPFKGKNSKFQKIMINYGHWSAVARQLWIDTGHHGKVAVMERSQMLTSRSALKVKEEWPQWRWGVSGDSHSLHVHYSLLSNPTRSLFSKPVNQSRLLLLKVITVKTPFWASKKLWKGWIPSPL